MGTISSCATCNMAPMASTNKANDDELKPFRCFLMNKYGNDFNKAFEELTVGKSGVSQTQFLRLAERAGYTGDAAAVFATLDADGSGKISAEEFMALQSNAESNAAMAFKQFKDFMTHRYKSPMLAFAAINSKSLDKVSKQDFITKLKGMHFRADPDAVFSCLDSDNDGFVSIDDFRSALKEPCKEEGITPLKRPIFGDLNTGPKEKKRASGSRDSSKEKKGETLTEAAMGA